MKININPFAVAIFSIVLLLIGCQKEELSSDKNVLSKFNLEAFEYFEKTLPSHMDTLFVGTDTTMSRKAALGRLLFYDTRLSENNSVSCATCHQQSQAFADGLQFSKGLFDRQTSRNSMALVNPAFQRSFFWDNTGRRLEEDVMKPIQNHIEMGVEDLAILPEKLRKVPYYKDLFLRAFEGTTFSGNGTQVIIVEDLEDISSIIINEKTISVALATFVKSLYSYHSKYDEGVAIDFKNFTIKERNGMELFFGEAKCADCHQEPYFGGKDWRLSANIGLDLEYKDKGRRNGIFKIPSLRNIQLTAPYMHDGRFSTLEDVINHYDHGVQAHKELGWELKDFSNQGKPRQLHLSNSEKEELIAFLNTLTDYTFIAEERFSNPF